MTSAYRYLLRILLRIHIAYPSGSDFLYIISHNIHSSLFLRSPLLPALLHIRVRSDRSLRIRPEYQDQQEFFAEIRFELLFRPVDPDACHAEAFCGIHQIAHHKRTIVHMCWNCLIGKYHKNDRCSIERIHSFRCSHDFTVFFRKLVTQFLIRHCKDDRGLFSHSGWRIGSGSYSPLRSIS